MSAHDDDDVGDGDDPQLTQLRAVWVSMREEDPPDRGLAALMAAARDKASEMAEPPGESWWKRTLAMLSRPPVLALASVAILLGGALVLTNHRDSVKSTSTIDDSQQVAAPAAQPPAPAAGSAAPTPKIEAPPVVQTVAPRLDPPAPPKPPSAPPKRPRPTSTRTEAATKGTAPVTAEDQAQGRTLELATGSLEPPPPPAPPPEAPVTRAPQRKAPVLETESTAPMDDAPRAKGEKKADADEIAADRGPSLSQLIQQCESAAARSDCTSVKLLAKRIKAQDAAAYQRRVVKNASIARCLE